MSVTLDPTTLPPIKVLELAQTGALLRAERETPPDGIPAFITQEGWRELVSTYATNHEAPHEIILPALEKATSRLMSHAAKAAGESGRTLPVIRLESDLFPSDTTLILAFVRDETYPVACSLIGTAHHLTHLLKTTF